MPTWAKGLIALVIALLALNIWTCYRVNRVYTYLGSAVPADDPGKWSGLIGNLTQHAADVRRLLNEHDCRLLKLENKPPCGPPGTVPKDPPGGPP